MEGRSVLVTGARGLIGRAVVRRLRAHAQPVMAVVRPGGTSDPGEIAVDLAEPGLELSRQLPRPAAIVHLAAAVPNRPGDSNDETTAELTRRIDHTIFCACETWRVPAVYASGTGLYDWTDAATKREDAALVSHSPYHAAKVEGDRLFQDLEGACIARISSPYGQGLSPQSVLAKWLAIAGADEALALWGEGAREQDFIHVDDVARFIDEALSHAAQGVFNVASGHPVTMRDLADAVVRATRRGSWRFSGRPDPQECHFARFNVSKARQLLGWTAAVPLEEGLRKLITEAERA